MELKNNSKIYLDTNLFIYYFEGNKKFSEKIEKIFEEAINKNSTLISSELLYLELLVLPYKVKDRKILDLYKNIEKYIPNLHLIPVSKTVLIEASKIRAKYNFKSPDSIHLATAFTENCDLFIGSDKKLRSYKKVKVEII